MFSVGDLVYYPMHGVGTIETIEKHTVLGAADSYYSLRFLNGKMTALVPVSTADRVGLRSLISADECQDVLTYMKTSGERGSDNWNQRYRDNLDKLRGGNVYEVADVIKCLSMREAERGLSAGERKMLIMARSILVTELATVLDTATDTMEQLIG